MAFESLIFESLPLGNLPAAFNHLGGWNWGGGAVLISICSFATD